MEVLTLLHLFWLKIIYKTQYWLLWFISTFLLLLCFSQSLNAALFYENKNPKEYVSLVPTSAHSGDGMGNLLALICKLTQTMLAKKVSYSDELHSTVMEVGPFKFTDI